jgi:hypothetical protein
MIFLLRFYDSALQNQCKHKKSKYPRSKNVVLISPYKGVLKINKAFVIPESLYRGSSVLKAFKVTGFPIQAFGNDKLFFRP